MKIDEVIEVLQKYREEYGNIPVAFISNNGEKSEINNIDVIGISNDEDFEHEEEVAIFIDKFDYENEQDMEYVSDEDWANGYPGYDNTEEEKENSDYDYWDSDDYWDSGCPIEDKEEEDIEDE